MDSDDGVKYDIENDRIWLRLLLSSFLLLSGGLAAILVVYRPTTALSNMIHTGYVVLSFISSMAGYIGVVRQMVLESTAQSAIQLAAQTLEKS
jgi:hypothetical protein